MKSKPLVIFVLSMAFVIWQWVHPFGSPGMGNDLLINLPVPEVEEGKGSEEVIRQKDGVVRGARGPFSLPAGVRQNLEMEQSGQIHSEVKSIKVEGILVSGSVKRAIINDKIFSVGDRLENWQVMDIQRRSVILGYEDKRIEIPVSENPVFSGSGM